MGLKEKIKEQAHYMKVGAKVLPNAIKNKAKAYVAQTYEAAKQDAILKKEAQAVAQKAYAEEYKKELIKQEVAKTRQKAQARAQGKSGAMGILSQLGAAGERISMAEELGMGQGKQRQGMGSVGDYIMPSGFGSQSRRQGKGNPFDIDTGGAIFDGLPRAATRPPQMHSPRVIHRHRIVRRKRRQ